MKKTMVSISLLAADFLRLDEEITLAKNSGVDYLHFDVMDGHFVNNISFGIPLLKSISKNKQMPNDVHLMITNPEKYVDSFIASGADIITFHYEALNKDEIIPLIDKIHSKSVKAGLSIKPHTEVKEILPYLKHLDLVLVMSVEPGFGGQSYLENSTDKIKQLRDYIDKNNLKTLIEVDGGINEETCLKAKSAGVDILVAGSYLFSHDDMAYRVNILKK
ncbi:MAG: ribulose-phosphate 3-epimerase [Bacilli bacterium]